MNVTVKPIDGNGDTILVNFKIGWTWSELYSVIDEINANTTYIQTIIFDLSHVTLSHEGMISQFPIALNILPVSVKVVYVISYENIMVRIYRIIKKLQRDKSGIQLKFVSDIDECFRSTH